MECKVDLFGLRYWIGRAIIVFCNVQIFDLAYTNLNRNLCKHAPSTVFSK